MLEHTALKEQLSGMQPKCLLDIWHFKILGAVNHGYFFGSRRFKQQGRTKSETADAQGTSHIWKHLSFSNVKICRQKISKRTCKNNCALHCDCDSIHPLILSLHLKKGSASCGLMMAYQASSSCRVTLSKPLLGGIWYPLIESWAVIQRDIPRAPQMGGVRNVKTTGMPMSCGSTHIVCFV